MAENVATENQPQERAGAVAEQATGHESFLGIEPELDTAAEEVSPETSAAAEGEGETAGAEGEAGEAQSAEAEQSDEPSTEEWLATLTPAERAQYAKRYPSAWKALNAPDQPDDIKQLLRDKINTDIEYRRLQEGGESQVEDATLEAEAEEAPAAAVQQATPEEQRKQYYQEVDRLVQNVVDPQSIKELGMELLAGFGVDVTSKEPEVQALIQNAPKVGATLARGAVDLVNTILPHVQKAAIESVFPGFAEMYDRSLHQLQWEKVRESKGTDGKPLYAALPSYGTPEFTKVLREAAAQIPGFDQMVFRGDGGRVLSAQQQAQMKYSILAKIAAGERVNPAVVRDAVETGKKLAQQTAGKRAAGKALGAGQSNQQFAAKGSDDPLMDDLDKEIARQNANLKPISAAR